MINTGDFDIMGRPEKVLQHPSGLSNELDWSSPVPDTNSTREIPLTQGKVALVDAADYERLSAFKWYAHRGRCNWYAQRHISGSRKIQPMHRFILGVGDTKVMVDHIDCDGLNNRRSNIRPATPSQNQANRGKYACGTTSLYKGVYRHKDGRWVASIKHRRKRKCLGSFPDEISAAHAYDAAAVRLFGEFANLNFPEKEVSHD